MRSGAAKSGAARSSGIRRLISDIIKKPGSLYTLAVQYNGRSQMFRTISVLLIANALIATGAAAAADREAGEWVIRKGGRVMVNGGREPVARLSELPSGDFRITGVDLTGTVMEPKELEHLAALEHVRELYLPGSAFTPGAGSKMEGNAELRVIAGMKDLERLQFSLHFLPYFNVT